MSSKHRISVSLSERQYRELSSISQEHKVSIAWLGRAAIEEMLKRIQNEQIQLVLNLIPNKSSDKG